MAKYSYGMYGGSFNPLHLGHLRCMISAANQCERLIIVISNGLNRDDIDIRQRYRLVERGRRDRSELRLDSWKERNASHA